MLLATHSVFYTLCDCVWNWKRTNTMLLKYFTKQCVHTASRAHISMLNFLKCQRAKSYSNRPLSLKKTLRACVLRGYRYLQHDERIFSVEINFLCFLFLFFLFLSFFGRKITMNRAWLKTCLVQLSSYS